MAKSKLEWGRLFKKLSPYTIQKGLRYLKHYGLKEFWVRLNERFEPEEIPYEGWYQEYVPTQKELERQKKRKWQKQIKISEIGRAHV